MTKLKDILSEPCGLRYMVESLDIRSGVARRMLLDTEMMTSCQDIEKEYAALATYVRAINDTANLMAVKTLQFRLQGLKDIRTTLSNLKEGRVLDDIELFEIKHLSMLAGEVARQMTQVGLEADWQCTEDITRILDPEGLHIATFYVYDAYSELLQQMHRQQETEKDNIRLAEQIAEEENRIRTELSRNLRSYASILYEVLIKIAQVDIRTAKALQVRALGLCFPTLGNGWCLTQMWNPELNAILEKKGKTVQRNTIQLGDCPTILTGANMGGKTVVLKTVALCQYLMQMGFGIPAEKAEMHPFEAVFTCIADGQSMESGLSSFAAEMKGIDNILTAARQNRNILALIDEPARTTNPTEGTALVSALIAVLRETACTTLLVTHYCIRAYGCPCLRVRGLENGEMNYELLPALAGEVPHEALHIAEQLGIDNDWIRRAKKELEED